jgi:DNA (cytosine-5)-methyltransferase 1
MSRAPFSFYEFFAGGGMARLGLGERWACVFANDFDRPSPIGSPTSGAKE